MKWDFEKLNSDVEAEIRQATSIEAIEDFRIKYLGRKGLLQDIFAALSSADKNEKPLLGKKANLLRQKITKLIEDASVSIDDGRLTEPIDTTLPGVAQNVGHRHILSQTVSEICRLFEDLGFVIQDGPEIETEDNNFSALNIPENHPSRDGFDTFYLDQKNPKDVQTNLLLRSHTSPGQIRIMKQNTPPLAVVIPGRVYRPDAVDASHSFMFHQIEGLLVDENVNFSQLKGLLTAFCKRFFGDGIKMRFRPHFFPFTEPSAEVDISWSGGKKDWLEIMGCGMVHPKVFEAAGYKKGKYTGLAFGLGVERIAMLKYGIKDIRTFYENDIRFLKQF